MDDALLSTAWDDGSGNGRDDYFGWGLLQADAAALKAAYAPGGLTPDSDSDGVPDVTDPCPSVAGPVGGTGCPPPPPDADGDGLADAQDPCPAVAGPAGGTGCPMDSDGDGVLDPQDPCPTVAGPVGAGGCPLPQGPSGPTVVVRVKAKSGGSKLFVDVDPNKGSGYWRFQVQRLDPGTMTWKARKTYRTKGTKETRTINLPKGTYRVVVASKYGYLGDASAGVKLRK